MSVVNQLAIVCIEITFCGIYKHYNVLALLRLFGYNT